MVVEALLIGKEAEAAASKVSGVGKVIAVPYDGDYDTAVWTAAAAEAAGDGCLILASHTAIARDFTPRLGARLGAPNVPDVIEMSGGGIASRADMIAEAQSADAPTGPYTADSYKVKMISDDVAIMTHHAGAPDPHYSLHVWQKKGGKWVVVASASAPETKD